MKKILLIIVVCLLVSCQGISSTDQGMQLDLPNFYKELELFNGYIYYGGLDEANRIGLYRVSAEHVQQPELVLNTNYVVKNAEAVTNLIHLYKKKEALVFNYSLPSPREEMQYVAGFETCFIDADHTLYPLFESKGRPERGPTCPAFDFDSTRFIYIDGGSLVIRDRTTGNEHEHFLAENLWAPGHETDSMKLIDTDVFFIAAMSDSDPLHIYHYDLGTEILKQVSDLPIRFSSNLVMAEDRFFVTSQRLLRDTGMASPRFGIDILNSLYMVSFDGSYELVADHVQQYWYYAQHIFYSSWSIDNVGVHTVDNGLYRLDIHGSETVRLIPEGMLLSNDKIVFSDSLIMLPVRSKTRDGNSLRIEEILILDLHSLESVSVDCPVDQREYYASAEGNCFVYRSEDGIFAIDTNGT